jgi:hypothetical protein
MRVCALLVCIVSGNTQPKQSKGWESILKQVNRFIHLERLLPSYHNRVTVACIKVMKKFQACGKARLDLDFFTSYTSYGHYRKVHTLAALPLHMRRRMRLTRRTHMHGHGESRLRCASWR